MNFKPGDVVRHKKLNILGRIISVPDGANMHWKIDWLSATNCDRIVTDWFVHEHLELSELGTILDLESKSRGLILVTQDGKELQRCQRYYEKTYDERKTGQKS